MILVLLLPDKVTALQVNLSDHTVIGVISNRNTVYEQYSCSYL